MPHIDTETVEELRELMEEDFDILIQTYLRDSSVRMEELKALLDGDDSDKARNVAHILKGSSSNIGAPDISAIAAKMEDSAKNGDMDTFKSLYPEAEAQYQEVVKAFNEVLG